MNGEIGRLCAAQDVIDIGGGATKEVYPVDPVGEQSAVSDLERVRIGAMREIG